MLVKHIIKGQHHLRNRLRVSVTCLICRSDLMTIMFNFSILYQSIKIFVTIGKITKNGKNRHVVKKFFFFKV